MLSRRSLAVGTLAFALTTLAGAPSALGMTFSFGCVTFNDLGDCAIAEAQVEMEVVAGPGAGQVSFTFTNTGPGMSTIARIYFDDGSLSDLDSIINGPGVNFVFEPFPGPSDLPGGNNANPPFMTTMGFLSGAGPPPPSSGVENVASEFVTLVFDLQGGQTVGDVIAELQVGTLRAGVHVINFDSGGSEGLVSLPEPGLALLLGSGIIGLALRRRAR